MTVRAAPLTRKASAFVRRGGSTSAEASPEEKAKPVLLNVPTALLEQVDRAVKALPVRIPRHTWILEAIVQRLEREG